MTKQHILIVGPSWVGDTMMAQGLFQLLKKNNPQAKIDVLAPAWTFALLKRMQEVSEALVLPFEHGELRLKDRYQFGVSLRERHYDEAIVLPNSAKSAIIPWAARIPKRTGSLGEFRFGLLNDIRYLKQKLYPRMIEQYLALGLPAKTNLPRPLPIPSIKVSLDQQAAVLAKFNITLTDQPILALCPGAAFGSGKCWPPSYFAEVAKQKRALGYRIWLFGSKQDVWATNHIASELQHEQCDNWAGKLTLDDTVDLLSQSAVVLSNDSGLMHVAAALDKPIFALYGPTSPAFTPPLSNKAAIISLHLPCQPCFKRTCPLKHHHCMVQLTPDLVLEKMQHFSLSHP